MKACSMKASLIRGSMKACSIFQSSGLNPFVDENNHTVAGS
jgi:hypothetical protein